MSEYIAMDCHKRYSLVEWEDQASGKTRQRRIEHRRGAIRATLVEGAPGTKVALEATGNWYWIADEIEQAQKIPQLVHPRKAKLMMGLTNKTDKLDVHGLNRLQRNQTLPTVWLAPAAIRDLRELTRGRMVLTRQRTRLKNRLSAALAKYGWEVRGYSDRFGKGARPQLRACLAELPEHTQWMSQAFLRQLDFVEQQIARQERRLVRYLRRTRELAWLQTLPGVGLILAAVIAWEVGDVTRFASAEKLAAYAGTTPRVHSSGDQTRYGKLRPDVNRYLKWALVEAANAIVLHQDSYPQRHLVRVYQQVRDRKGHAKAIGAVARRLAQAVYYVLQRQEAYREPATGRTVEA